jgi:predicted GIY-YIG superfamily endonuclease
VLECEGGKAYVGACRPDRLNERMREHCGQGDFKGAGFTKLNPPLDSSSYSTFPIVPDCYSEDVKVCF